VKKKKLKAALDAAREALVKIAEIINSKSCATCRWWRRDGPNLASGWCLDQTAKSNETHSCGEWDEYAE